LKSSVNNGDANVDIERKDATSKQAGILILIPMLSVVILIVFPVGSNAVEFVGRQHKAFGMELDEDIDQVSSRQLRTCEPGMR